MRDFGRQGFRNSPGNLIQHRAGSELAYELRSDFTKVHDGVEYETNSDGLRDREFAVKKPEGTERIVFIGDSYTFGLGLKLEYSFVKQLERLLSENKLAAKHWEVINLGVPGYNTVSEVKRLRDKGLKYSPKVVVVMFYLDDVHIQDDNPSVDFPFSYESLFSSNEFAKQVEDCLENDYGKKGEAKVTPRKCSIIKKYLKDHHQASFIEQLEREVGTNPSTWHYYYYLSVFFKPVSDALDELANLSRENDFTVVAGIIPWTDVNTWDDYPYSTLHSLLRREFESRGFLTVDTKDVLSDYLGARLVLSDEDCHTGAFANMLIAMQLERQLIENHLVY